ncbi:hypothetical protein C0991_004509 [Blastosporella zonata]|nr:hypothetical protein C0991_004509 [Blastosporella zonata]
MDSTDLKVSRLAAVTCAVLAHAGPNRSRVLASLYRDERTLDLPTYNVLSKMFLDHILRSAEVKEFQKTLKPHQLAKIAISSNDRLASTGQYGAPAGVDELSASTRTGPATVLDRAVMEQNLLASSHWFEGNGEEDDAQGKAGGLGDVEEAEDTGAPFTKRWDTQIRLTAANLESIVQHLTEKGLVRLAAAA